MLMSRYACYKVRPQAMYVHNSLLTGNMSSMLRRSRHTGNIYVKNSCPLS